MLCLLSMMVDYTVANPDCEWVDQEVDQIKAGVLVAGGQTEGVGAAGARLRPAGARLRPAPLEQTLSRGFLSCLRWAAKQRAGVAVTQTKTLWAHTHLTLFLIYIYIYIYIWLLRNTPSLWSRKRSYLIVSPWRQWSIKRGFQIERRLPNPNFCK